MLFLLDCIYYLCCNFYKGREKYTFKDSGIVLLGSSLLMNVIYIFDLLGELGFYPDFYIKIYSLSKLEMLIILIIVFAIVGFPVCYRYTKITSYDTISRKISKSKSILTNICLLISLIYLLHSFFHIICYFIYMGLTDPINKR